MNIAAVWDMILSCEWGKIWWGITHAHWANVWASISAIFTALAVIVAGWAMFRWKKQDELKAKMEFKQAVADYVYALLKMPIHLGATPKDRAKHKEEITDLINKFSHCRNTLLYCEAALDKELDVLAHWKNIYDCHAPYLDGKKSSVDLVSAGDGILKTRFVFK